MANSKIKILAIDDNNDNLVVLKALINDAFPDAAYLSADSGLKGFTLCSDEKPDVVLLDIVMPGMDGYEVCAKLKSDISLKHIPVVMVTANRADKESRVKALEMGADAFLPKPVDESELKAQIRAMLRIKESEDNKRSEKQTLENMVLERTEALELELAERKKTENKLMQSLDKITRNRQAIMNLMEDLKVEINVRKLVEESLQNERNLLRTLIDNLRDPIYILDKDGRKVVANKADLQNLGFKTEKEVLGKNDRDLFPGEVGERGHIENMFVINNESPVVDREENIIDNEGNTRWLLTSKYPLNDTSGKVNGLIGIGHDITNRKLSEIALKESYDFNNSILSTIPFGMDIVDSVGTILFHSQKFQNLFGHDAIGKKCWELYKDDKKQCAGCPLSGGIKIGRTENYESAGVLGGRIFDISHTGILFHGEEAMLEIFIDITERKAMEQKIIESEAYYRTLIEISPDGIIIADLEGRVSYGSIKAYEIFGIPPGEKITGTSVLTLIADDYHNVILERIVEIISGNAANETCEYELRKFDGTEFWGELSSSPLVDSEGNSNAMLIVCRDISDRKLAESDLIKSKERAEESDRLKTAFLHNISHEIRTPMNAIMAFSTFLKEPGLDQESQRSYIDIITQSSNNLLSIVSDIIEISNIEAGTLKINPKSTNLNAFMKSIHLQFIPRAAENGLGFGLEIRDSEVGILIEIDEAKVIRVLSNLLNNAFKFTLQGRIDFGYSLKDGILEFFVSDTGIGIPEEHSKRIFERFFQVENSVARRYEGTGLGLSISKAYVELLGGEIWYNSQPDKGSTFFFTVPIIREN